MLNHKNIVRYMSISSLRQGNDNILNIFLEYVSGDNSILISKSL